MSNINQQWTTYNSLHNEGGDGYNPHSKFIGETGEPEWSLLQDRADKLMRILNGTSESDPMFAEWTKQYDAAHAAYKAAFAAYMAA